MRCITVLLLSVLLAWAIGCAVDDQPTAPTPSPDADDADKASLRRTGFIVANFSPPDGLTDAIIRYDGRGDLVDVMIPTGTAGLSATAAMVFGPDEHLYVADSWVGGVKRFHGLTGEFIDDFVPAGSGGLILPIYMVFHGDRLYVGDGGAGAVRRYDAMTGAYVDDFIPAGDQGLAPFDPQDIEFGPDGNFYVVAQGQNRVLRYDPDGVYLDDFHAPLASGVAFDADGMLYVGEAQDHSVWRYDTVTGELVDVFVAPGCGGLEVPVGIVFGPDGDLYVASAHLDNVSGNILRFDGETGEFVEVFVPNGVGGMSGPRVILFKETVTLCHQPPGNPDRSRTLTLPYLNGFGHVAHGDMLGACD